MARNLHEQAQITNYEQYGHNHELGWTLINWLAWFQLYRGCPESGIHCVTHDNVGHPSKYRKRGKMMERDNGSKPRVICEPGTV